MSDLSAIVKAYDVRGTVPDQVNEDVARALGAASCRRCAAAGDPVDAHRGRPRHARVVARPGVRLRRRRARRGRRRGRGRPRLDRPALLRLGRLDLPGAMFTASHNPAEYNGVKMCRAGAKPIGQDTGLAEIRDRAQAILDGRGVTLGEPTGTVERARPARRVRGPPAHAGRPLQHPAAEGRRRRRQRDGRLHGAGGARRRGAAPLPLEIVPLYFELDGSFPNHEANPLEPKNIVDLQQAVVAHRRRRRDRLRRRRRPVLRRRRRRATRSRRAPSPRWSPSRELAQHPGSTVIHNLITSRAVPEIVRRARRHADPQPGRPLVHQGRDGPYRRGLRRRALGALLLPRLLGRRHRHARRDARPRRAGRAGPAAGGAGRASTSGTRLGRDQDQGDRPDRRRSRRWRGASRRPTRTSSTGSRSTSPTARGPTCARPTPSRAATNVEGRPRSGWRSCAMRCSDDRPAAYAEVLPLGVARRIVRPTADVDGVTTVAWIRCWSRFWPARTRTTLR